MNKFYVMLIFILVLVLGCAKVAEVNKTESKLSEEDEKVLKYIYLFLSANESKRLVFPFNVVRINLSINNSQKAFFGIRNVNKENLSYQVEINSAKIGNKRFPEYSFKNETFILAYNQTNKHQFKIIGYDKGEYFSKIRIKYLNDITYDSQIFQIFVE